MNFETIQQIMLIKYYNCIMNLKSEKFRIESWDIYRREKYKDRIYEVRSSFTINMKKVLNQFM